MKSLRVLILPPEQLIPTGSVRPNKMAARLLPARSLPITAQRKGKTQRTTFLARNRPPHLLMPPSSHRTPAMAALIKRLLQKQPLPRRTRRRRERNRNSRADNYLHLARRDRSPALYCGHHAGRVVAGDLSAGIFPVAAAVSGHLRFAPDRHDLFLRGTQEPDLWPLNWSRHWNPAGCVNAASHWSLWDS